MSFSKIDHITITSPSLDTGAEFVRQTLGVEPQSGGEHPAMGTHNLLLRLGDSQYLEVISPNPEAEAPQRPRWFNLDCLEPGASPMLSTWVVCPADIHAMASASSESLGTIEPMSRGALNWLITLPDDGSIPLDGVAPALIEWHTDIHPASRLENHGLCLNKIEIFHHEPARVIRLLASLNIDGPISVSTLSSNSFPHLIAYIDTPRGMRKLSVSDSNRL
ncbi:MAG: VOC family protein [Gammaproteobacteria bacterium]